ncbi:short-chain collagen C4-like [Mya arenaria]|uniref:short-chain collagen C4-like n=1 Tax=Mya arenaria TaxID=6604 RepID=UPI0022E8DAA4|nr:short-chain collagen C4-like [Mya arenaria]
MNAKETDYKRVLLGSEQELAAKVISLEATVAALENKLHDISQKGSVYTRWGRNVCPGSSELVYKGFTAGKYFNEAGSGSDEQCLPSDPTWGRYVDGNYGDYRARIFGAEIDLPEATRYFPYDVFEQDIPCAVCRTNHSINIMIPARTSCYAGWTEEYSGFLMAGTHERIGAFDHICVDGRPEFLQHGGTNDNQNILYLVEAQCGSLPCPPYVQGRELACIVCSK